MLFMIIERFKGGDAAPVGARFRQLGRMLPVDVVYVDSWVETSGSSCFQIMEAPNRESLNPWIDRWKDLVDFEIIPVLTSRIFWSSDENRKG